MIQDVIHLLIQGTFGAILKDFKNKYECVTIDGVRIKYNHGWALIRSSNTQPVIVFRFESNSEQNLDKIKNEVFSKLNELSGIKYSG